MVEIFCGKDFFRQIPGYFSVPRLYDAATGELTIDECEQAVQRLRINKAPGSDGLTSEFLQNILGWCKEYVSRFN